MDRPGAVWSVTDHAVPTKQSRCAEVGDHPDTPPHPSPDPNPDPHHECMNVFRCMTLIGDGTEVHKTHVESAVFALDNGERVNIIPWFQGDKAGQSTCDHTILQVDLCQEAYGLLYEHVTEHDRALLEHLVTPAPNGTLLVSVKNTQNDHAAGELRRVDCLELALRVLLDDPTLELNRATCGHHKIGTREGGGTQ